MESCVNALHWLCVCQTALHGPLVRHNNPDVLRAAGPGLAAMRQWKRLGCVLLGAALLWTDTSGYVTADADVLSARSLKQLGETLVHTLMQKCGNARATDRTWAECVRSTIQHSPIVHMYVETPVHRLSPREIAHKNSITIQIGKFPVRLQWSWHYGMTA